MKKLFLFISIVLSFVCYQQVSATSCNDILFDSFDTDGALPSDWVEYNTTGSAAVVDGILTITYNATKPAVYKSFTSVSDNVTFSFDMTVGLNSSTFNVNLVSSTGQYLSSIGMVKGSPTIKYATSISSSLPSSFVDASTKVAFVKNTYYTISVRVDFDSQTVDYYCDGQLMVEGLGFLQAATDVSKIDIKTLDTYSNDGFFYFDNIKLSSDDENRWALSNQITVSEGFLATAVVGTLPGEYAQDDCDIFQAAIDAAIALEEDCATTDAEITQAQVDLETAQTTFEASTTPVGQSVTINVLDTKQEIIMMGGDMERNAPALQNAPNRDSIVHWLIKDIPFDTYRVKYDKLQEMTEGDQDFYDTYADQVLSMKMILKANPDIKFYATMKSDYHGYSQGNRNNLPTFIYDYEYDSSTETYLGTKAFDAVKYGVFLADYVEIMSDSDVPISYLSTSKEWTQVMTPARAKTAIETLITTLEERNVEMPLIIDPGAWSITQGYNTVVSYLAEDVDKYVYGYSTHNYSSGSKTWSDFSLAANNAGKIAIDDESGHGSGGPTYGAYEMPITKAILTYANKCDMYAGGIQGEIFFELWMGNFNYARPIMFSETEDGRRIRSYYIMKKFAENTAKATYVEQSAANIDGVSTMAFIKDEKLVLWMINEGHAQYSDCPVYVSNLGLEEGMTIHQTYWDSTSVITGVNVDIIANSDIQFKADILPRSINCFIISPNSDETSSKTIKSPEALVSVYPNPTTDFLFINTSEQITSVAVFDMNGVQMQDIEFNANSIKMSSLDDGMYFVSVTTANGENCFKVMKH